MKTYDLSATAEVLHCHQETVRSWCLGVPLNTQALEVLNRRFGQHQTFVFASPKTQKPLGGICSKIWKVALSQAGITDFRWHDIRHTWASWLVQSGVPIMDLKEMGGWESIEMVQKYAYLAPMHLHKTPCCWKRSMSQIWHTKKEKPLQAVKLKQGIIV
ncbi:tyrosine-type recombinase/integrase [Paralysiella testudinis]|uniref:Tyrosine-type recombinase/integrase n=1 Tax=Paralysiella testudinis TaxID=2809020 RepID=A0A892ZIB2_9NEIS|nr:tyrosine-type recombinase/integrase [Paralysiella testudinis]QRQ80669.1 tyrosine-type recombinase/integrase [Paralysiella testudinis]